MNSWDLFDTLVAARSGRAGDTEVEDHFPIIENVLKIQPGDLIISDYLDNAKALRIVQDVVRVDNRLIVTPEGKQTGSLWATIQPKPTLHRGDSVLGDYQQARAHGVLAELTTLSNYTLEEAALRDVGFISVAKTMRESRLSSFGNFRELELIQSQLNFPFLFLGALCLHRYVIAQGFENVLMSSRDASLWIDLMRWIRNMNNSAYGVEYFYSSRIARHLPSLEYLQYCRRATGEKKTLLVDVVGTGISIKALLDRLNIMSGWLLVGYPKAVIPSGMQGTNDGAKIEHANLARHPMVADVVGGTPKYFNAANIDWENAPEIVAMHKSFYHTISCMSRYDFSADVQVSDDTLRRQMYACYDRMKVISTRFTQKFWVEDSAILNVLKNCKHTL